MCPHNLSNYSGTQRRVSQIVKDISPVPPAFALYSDITWILEHCAMHLFIDVQGGDILSSETGGACPYFKVGGVACKRQLE